MPIYEFECNKKHKFEKLVKYGTTTTKCEQCGATSRKLLSVPAIIFKGKGFYKTDTLPERQKKEVENDKVIREAKRARAATKG